MSGWPVFALVAVAVVVLVGGAAVWWLERESILGGLGELSDLEMTWTPEPFPNTGTRPMSSRISGSFVRWHKSEYYWTGDAFWRTFQDGPWKWDDQQRYAGKGDNCGHYFALTERGASAEATFYGMDRTQSRLLTAEFEFDAILDLTYEENLVKLAKLAISNWERISARHFILTILSMLTDNSRGGVPFTDFVGHWASREGYDGILFFGARALENDPDLKAYIDGGADDGMMGPLVHGYFHDMRKQNDLKNLVIFSGARLTSKIRTTGLTPDPASANQYCGATEEALDRIVDFKEEYQSERASEGMYLAQPFTIA